MWQSIRLLKANLGLLREDCQHAVTDEFLCMVAGCALGADVCHWMFKTKSTWLKVNKIPLVDSIMKDKYRVSL